MSTARQLRTAYLMMTMAVLASCGDATGSKSGGVSIMLRDAPANFKKAMVTIDQVYLQPGAEDGSSRVVLVDTAVTTDLLTLANDVKRIVDDAKVPAGTYAQLRFVISGACIDVDDVGVFSSSSAYASAHCGATTAGTLQMPSFAQSGLKVTLPNGGVTIGTEEEIVMVDFDVSRSFGKEAGNSGKWVMTPSLKATDFSVTGSVKVAITNLSNPVTPLTPLSDLGVSLLVPTLTTDSLATTLTGVATATATGAELTFRYMPPGSYKALVTLAGRTLTVDPSPTATLTSGGTANIELKVTKIETVPTP